MVPMGYRFTDAKDRRQVPDRRGQGRERRGRTEPKIQRLFREFEFEDQRRGDRRSGKDRRSA